MKGKTAQIDDDDDKEASTPVVRQPLRYCEGSVFTTSLQPKPPDNTADLTEVARPWWTIAAK